MADNCVLNFPVLLGCSL